jgi:hypothetical protein
VTTSARTYTTLWGTIPLQVTTVQLTLEATQLEKQFDRETTDLMNKGGSGVHAEIWNRSHLKALKLAALVATGVNHYCPQITAKEMQWAIDVERHNITDLLVEMENGEVGEERWSCFFDQNAAQLRWIRVSHQAAIFMGSVLLAWTSSGVNMPWVEWGRSAL